MISNFEIPGLEGYYRLQKEKKQAEEFLNGPMTKGKPIDLFFSQYEILTKVRLKEGDRQAIIYDLKNLFNESKILSMSQIATYVNSYCESKKESLLKEEINSTTASLVDVISRTSNDLEQSRYSFNSQMRRIEARLASMENNSSRVDQRLTDQQNAVMTIQSENQQLRAEVDNLKREVSRLTDKLPHYDTQFADTASRLDTIRSTQTAVQDDMQKTLTALESLSELIKQSRIHDPQNTRPPNTTSFFGQPK